MNNKDSQSAHANTVIRNHVVWSMGAGLIPIIIADIFAVSALQVDMIKQLCNAYGKDFEHTKGKAYVTALSSSTLARLGARSIIKLIPGVGSYVGGVAVSIFAGASTYALGQVFKAHFESGGTILDFDPERVKKYYQEMFEKGKQKAKQWQDEEVENPSPSVDVTPTNEAEEEIVEAPEKASDSAEPIEDESKIEIENDPLAKLQKLADLKDKGIITEEEFIQMKTKLIDSF